MECSFQPKERDEPCDNQINCNSIDEDITLHDDIKTESSDNNVIVIDDESQNDMKIRHSSSSGASDAIYIDSVGGEEGESNNIDISRI